LIPKPKTKTLKLKNENKLLIIKKKKMEKYLYFRSDSTAANDDDAAGSVIYPVSRLKGMVMGDMAVTGAITEDDDRFAITFEPMAISPGGGEDQAKTNNIDIVNIDITTDNGAKAVMSELVRAINSVRATNDGFIIVYDAVTGESIHPDIEGIHVVEVNANA
jgi:hypothetical protein|tara:strand:+ start:129 stop:614 length:486 start_codon:yes stop_codon:yes gene_type:complete